MKALSFTIIGNHSDEKGNAVPKAKLTKRQQWTDKAQNYSFWKTHIVSSLFGFEKVESELAKYIRNYSEYGKPIVLQPGEHARMSLRIKFADAHHGDPENIFGSIADALFHNDKKLDINTVSSMSKSKEGRVSVTIHIFESEEEWELFSQNIL